MFKFVRSKSVWLILPFYCCFRFLFSEISLRTFVLFGIFRVALLFICQGAVPLIGSVSRRTFVPVAQTAYLVYHKQFCLSRTFFILFSSFFRNPVAYHSQQQFSSLSELAVRVKQFFSSFFEDDHRRFHGRFTIQHIAFSLSITFYHIFTSISCCLNSVWLFGIKKEAQRSGFSFLAELTEKEGFEPSRRFNTTYTLSRGASSAS